MTVEQGPGPAEVELDVAGGRGLLGNEGEEEREEGETDLPGYQWDAGVGNSLNTLSDQIVLTEPQ